MNAGNEPSRESISNGVEDETTKTSSRNSDGSDHCLVVFYVAGGDGSSLGRSWMIDRFHEWA